MKKVVISCFLLFALLLQFQPFHVAYATDNSDEITNNSSVVMGCRSYDAQQSLLGAAKLIDNAEAVFLYETKSDTLMYSWNADAQVYPSSLAKIVTAIVAIENGDLDEKVSVKEKTLSTIPSDAASSDLVDGEKISLRDLLYCMMVDSANDAAVVIAEHIAGTQTSFVERMNKYAIAAGCSNTNFTNVTGLHDPMQVTTVRDLAKILGSAIQNKTFLEIFGTSEYTVEATNKSEQRFLVTGNFLMDYSDMQIYYDERVTGGRTGTNADGTRCLAATAQGNDMQMISIVMGSKSVVEKDGYSVSVFGSFKETSQLLDAGLNGFRYAQVLYAGQVMEQRQIPGSANDLVVGCVETVNAIIPVDATSENLSYRYSQDAQQVSLPIAKGAAIGSVEVWYKDLCLAQSGLYSMNQVRTDGDVSIDHNRSKSATWVIVLLCVFGAVAFCIAGYYLYNRFSVQLRRRRRRR